LHTVHSLIFEQQLVVFGDGDEEKDGGNILKAVNPLLSFGPLATDVEHTVSEVSNDEGCLSDAGSLDTRSEDVLVAWEVVGLSDARDGIKIAAGSLLVCG
jgi:hypothetical protein